MTITVDTFTLKSQRLSDGVVLIASDWDEWKNGVVTKKRKVYGAKGQWTLRFFEGNVDWGSSGAKYLRDKAKSGGTVTLTIDQGNRFSLSATSCYVVAYSMDTALVAGKNLRHFTVTFREV